MADIFISYKREEQPVARKLADALQKKGWSVWWDPKLRAGDHFDDAIERALNDAKCVIVMWSKLSVKSRYVKDEATYALKRKKLVPILIDEVDLPFRFEGLHTGQLINWDGSDNNAEYQRLVSDISKIIAEEDGRRRNKAEQAAEKVRKRRQEEERKLREKEQEKTQEELQRLKKEIRRLADEKQKLKEKKQRREAARRIEEERKQKEADAKLNAKEDPFRFELRKLKVAEPTSVKKAITNSISMRFVLIPAGKFMMGSPPDEPGRRDDEKQHEVNINKPFYMQTTQVSQGQWKRVMGRNPSIFKHCGDDCPAENVSWHNVQKFIKKLNLIEATFKYRLPTEAEWEYACRAGTETAYSFGNYMSKSGEYAWCFNIGSLKLDLDITKHTHPVGKKKPNAWGLYDMHGNVWEWCQDWYGEYPSNSVADPKGPANKHFSVFWRIFFLSNSVAGKKGTSKGNSRVRRGGSFHSFSSSLRSASRGQSDPGYRDKSIGFRVAREL